MDFARKDRYDINDLLDIVRILREPGGCPWDREQTHPSIRKSLIEETYEVADAIDQNDMGLLCEELGDLLLQIALHAQMEAEAGGFTFDDVCDGISKKLIYRHPHVFGDLSGEISTGQVLKNWEALKNTEKGRDSAVERLDSVPVSLPSPMRAAKVQKRAAAYGFAYKDTAAALKDLDSEVAELKAAIDAGEDAEAKAEIGDVLFSAVNVSRFLGADAEESLSASTGKFAARVKRCEALAAQNGKALEEVSAEELDALWKQAKAEEKT